MSQNGEKELVLGNNQLLGLFFVLMAICAVAFSLGYMVGKNSTAPKDATAASITPADSVTTEPERESPKMDAVAAVEQPQSQINNDPASAGSQPAPVEAPAVTPAPTPAPVRAAPVEVKGPVTVSTPVAGESYLQVRAMKRPDSDNLVKSLREQKFHAILAESSKEGYYRVLVGPYEKASEKAADNEKLKSLGFSGAIAFNAK